VSRVGNAPIRIPDGVNVEVKKNIVHVKGPKGEIQKKYDPSISVEIDDGIIYVKRPTNNRQHRAFHGLYRSLIYNMVTGVKDGFSKQLEIIGVGYRAELKGKVLSLQLGYSHPILFVPPEGINISVENPTTIKVDGIDKELVGLVSAKIRSFRPPEPYKGKGIRYSDESVRRKAGKSAG
jgi:large subunit ribosomal protein L6